MVVTQHPSLGLVRVAFTSRGTTRSDSGVHRGQPAHQAGEAQPDDHRWPGPLLSRRALTIAAATNPPDEADLAHLADTARRFAADRRLTIVPATPDRDCGPQVRCDPDRVPLDAFLTLAATLGGGVLYIDAEPFDPTRGNEHERAAAARFATHTGRVGCVDIAFATNGVVHFWERSTSWFDQWFDAQTEALAKARADAINSLSEDDLADELKTTLTTAGRDTPAGDTDAYPRRSALTDEEVAAHTQRIADLAEALVRHPEFRGARLGVRQRVGRTVISTLHATVDDSVAWQALRTADEQVETLAATAYEAVQGNLDSIARKLVNDAEFRAAATAGARKRVTEKVLTAAVDGFAPPAYLRDEVATRAYRQLRGLPAHQ